MKRYQFRLAHVERVRRIQEEQARAELLAARQRLMQAGADLNRSVDRYEERRSSSSLSSSSQFRSHRDRDDLLTMAVVAARSAEANALILVDQRLASWTEAARAVSALERLDERQRERHQIEADREEQAELDDLVPPRLAAKKRDDA
jgi:flagellar export protein FliJ